MDNFNMINYIGDQRQWSLKTFGTGPRTGGIIKHIISELQEVSEKPRDVYEWIDIIILAIDGAWRAGHDPIDICRALEKKQLINFKREYPMPSSQDEPSEHVKKEINKNGCYDDCPDCNGTGKELDNNSGKLKRCHRAIVDQMKTGFPTVENFIKNNIVAPISENAGIVQCKFIKTCNNFNSFCIKCIHNDAIENHGQLKNNLEII